MKPRRTALLATLALCCGCMSTKIVLNPAWDSSTTPSYTDHFDQYLFGFVGQPQVDLQQVCVDQRPHAVQRIKTTEDGILTLLSIGIYSPVTVNVWCGD